MPSSSNTKSRVPSSAEPLLHQTSLLAGSFWNLQSSLTGSLHGRQDDVSVRLLRLLPKRRFQELIQSRKGSPEYDTPYLGVYRLYLPRSLWTFKSSQDLKLGTLKSSCWPLASQTLDPGHRTQLQQSEGSRSTGL